MKKKIMATANHYKLICVSSQFGWPTEISTISLMRLISRIRCTIYCDANMSPLKLLQNLQTNQNCNEFADNSIFIQQLWLPEWISAVKEVSKLMVSACNITPSQHIGKWDDNCHNQIHSMKGIHGFGYLWPLVWNGSCNKNENHPMHSFGI